MFVWTVDGVMTVLGILVVIVWVLAMLIHEACMKIRGYKKRVKKK